MCFGNEIMSATNGNTVNEPFSRITVAAMDDLGYIVNYLAAEAYAFPNPANCPCARRRRRRTVGEAHNDDEQEEEAAAAAAAADANFRNLSEESPSAERLAAYEYGLNVLQNQQAEVEAKEEDGFLGGEEDSTTTTYGDWLSIAYLESDGSVSSILVFKEDLTR